MGSDVFAIVMVIAACGSNGSSRPQEVTCLAAVCWAEDHVAHSTLVLWRIHTSDSLNCSYLEDCEPTKSKTIGPDVVLSDTALCSQ